MNLYERFICACELFPNNIAVVDGKTAHTYKELLENVNRISNLINTLRDGYTGNICVYMNKTFDCVATIFAIYSCGCTFVPIDKNMPVSKLEYIIDDADALLVISDINNCTQIDVSWINLAFNTVAISKNIFYDSNHDKNVAYILYTSGTTGNPKGIEITHAAADAFVSWAQEQVQVKQLDNLASHAPFSFDLSVFDIYCALFSGAKLVLMQRGINAFVKSVRKYIENNRISIWYSVPSIIIKLLENDDGNTFKSLRVLIYAGESMPYKYVNKLNVLYPSMRILNFYGPTETNVITFYEIDKSRQYTDEIPIGYPCPYAKVSIIKEDGNNAEIGECGELCVVTKSRMKGYRNKPLLRDIYLTGDIVRKIDDNCYSFIGRKDNMVKVNGFRVELEEIESAIESYTSIETAVVSVQAERDVDVIIAFYTSKSVINQTDIQAFLSTQLQSYKIPTRFEKVDNIDFNDRGKKMRKI